LWIEIEYTESGFIAEIVLMTEAEQRLTDEQVAQHAWWPQQLRFIVPPVLAEPRERGLVALPKGQRFGVARSPLSASVKAEIAALLRAANAEQPPKARLSEAQLRALEADWHGGAAWVKATVRFDE
jgi:hypothetical protein